MPRKAILVFRNGLECGNWRVFGDGFYLVAMENGVKIQEEAYTEACEEIGRLKAELAETKKLMLRAAMALVGCTWQERELLIVELREAAK